MDSNKVFTEAAVPAGAAVRACGKGTAMSDFDGGREAKD